MTENYLHALEEILSDILKDSSTIQSGCQTPGCPATIRYTEIYHEDDNGWMLDIGGLLMWVGKSDGMICREDKTLEMELCRAQRLKLI